MRIGGSSLQLLSGRQMFRGGPDPMVACPVCGSRNMIPVAVEVYRGDRETVISSEGVHQGLRPLPADPDLVPYAQFGRCYLEIVMRFQCHEHESMLRMVLHGDNHTSATVEVRPSEGKRPPIWQRQPPEPRLRAQRGKRRVRGTSLASGDDGSKVVPLRGGGHRQPRKGQFAPSGRNHHKSSP
jgi:hypothetical protein